MEMLRAVIDEFLKASPLGQLSAIAAVIAIMGAIGGLSAWAMRRWDLRDLDEVRVRLDLRNKELDLEKSKRREFESEAEQLKQRLARESPRAWLATAEQERDPRNSNEIVALRVLGDGFDEIWKDLRRASLELAAHFDAISLLDPEAANRAWYFANVAAALCDGDDVRGLKDAVRESVARTAQRAGRYDPSAPEWNTFDLVPSGFSQAKAKTLLRQLSAHVQSHIQRGELFEAQRLLARTLHIASLALPPYDKTALTLRHNAVIVLFLSRAYQEAYFQSRELLEMMEQSGAPDFAPESPARLHLRHWRAACLLKLGRTEEGRAEAKEIVPLMKKTFGPEDPHVVVTLHMAEGKGDVGDEPLLLAANEGIVPAWNPSPD